MGADEENAFWNSEEEGGWEGVEEEDMGEGPVSPPAVVKEEGRGRDDVVENSFPLDAASASALKSSGRSHNEPVFLPCSCSPPSLLCRGPWCGLLSVGDSSCPLRVTRGGKAERTEEAVEKMRTSSADPPPGRVGPKRASEAEYPWRPYWAYSSRSFSMSIPCDDVNRPADASSVPLRNSGSAYDSGSTREDPIRVSS